MSLRLGYTSGHKSMYARLPCFIAAAVQLHDMGRSKIACNINFDHRQLQPDDEWLPAELQVDGAGARAGGK